MTFTRTGTPSRQDGAWAVASPLRRDRRLLNLQPVASAQAVEKLGCWHSKLGPLHLPIDVISPPGAKGGILKWWHKLRIPIFILRRLGFGISPCCCAGYQRDTAGSVTSSVRASLTLVDFSARDGPVVPRQRQLNNTYSPGRKGMIRPARSVRRTDASRDAVDQRTPR